MRTRLVIPAAILVAVAYVKGRRDARPAGATDHAATAAGPTYVSILRAQAEAADAREMGLDDLAQADLAAAEAAPALAEAPVAEPVAPDEPPVVDEPVVENVPVAEPAPAPRPPAWEPDPVALSEWLGTPAGTAPRVEVSGRFAVGGVAVQAGHMALCGVTFPSRIAGEVRAGRIRLVPEALENVSADGMVVLGDAGFAPNGDGFTLLVAAVAPGAFAVSGRYELTAGSAD